MKKLFSFLMVLTILLGTITKSFSQDLGRNVPLTMLNTWGQYAPSGTSVTVDSIRTFYLYTGPVFGYKDAVVIVGNITRTSGTQAGTATLQVSQDGTNWSPYTASTDTTAGKLINSTWTLVNNATPQTFRWRLLDAVDKYYRIALVTTSVSGGAFTANYSAYIKQYH